MGVFSTLLLVVACLLCSCSSYSNVGVSSKLGFRRKCDGGELFLLKGHTVQVTRSPSSLLVEGCEAAPPASPAAPAFAPARALADVTRLHIQHVAGWPPLPDDSRLEFIDMIDVELGGGFGGCSQLSSLRVEAAGGGEWTAPAQWLANCTRLRELTLALFRAASARDVIASAPQLHSLILDGLQDWPTVVRKPIFPTSSGRERSITKLSLEEISYRYKWGDEYVAQAQNTTWTAVSAAMAEQIATLTALEELFISRIMHFDLCPRGNVSSVTYGSLVHLTVSDTVTTRTCFGRLRTAPRLSRLSIGTPKPPAVFSLEYKELFSVRAPHLLVEVYLGNTNWIPVKGFQFEEKDYFALIDGTRRGNVTLQVLRLTVDCDCANAWLARALRERLLTAPAVTCLDGRQPADLQRERIECDKVSCIEACSCRRLWADGAVVAECPPPPAPRAPLTALPAALLRADVTDLRLAGHGIANIPDLPDHLQRLDLSHNVVSQLSASETAALFGSGRRVRLAGNPLVCACDYRATLQALQTHRHQVEDYDKLRCVNYNNTRIGEVNITVLCASRDREAAAAGAREATLRAAVTATLAAAAGALALATAHHFRRNIQIFLFARGWCLCLLREDDLDADRPYDVFLSFCHADERVVLEEILPALDGEFSVCVHVRDWCPGEMIPTQIMKSVELSKRTIVVLSRGFVRSLWGVLEFRAAFAAGVRERRTRVLVLVLDDVLESGELHGELRAYVQLNTYVRWQDPWLWDKLRYALPHRPRPARAPRPPQRPQTPHACAMEMAAIPRYHTSPDVGGPGRVQFSETNESYHPPLTV